MYRSNSQRKRKKSQTTTKQTLNNANILNSDKQHSDKQQTRHSDKQQTKEPGDILYLYQLEKNTHRTKTKLVEWQVNYILIYTYLLYIL